MNDSNGSPVRDWVEWTGGENPVPGQIVDYRWIGHNLFDAELRTPSVQEGGGIVSDQLDWSRDIIAYRVIPQGFVETTAVPASVPSAQDDQPSAQTGEVPQIFLDCDGVLADFDTYAEAYFGMNPRAYEKAMGSARFWAELEAKGDFYRNLPLMPDARALVDGVRHLNPTILTGCPRGNWAEGQKVAWAEEHFSGIPIITCRSADKRVHAKPGDVLIDDWPQHRHRWIEHGGVFISHFDAETSLAALWAHYPTLRATGDR